MRAFERYLTEAEQQALLRHMHLRRADALARRDGALMRLLLHTGMRLGETLGLTQAEALQALRTGWLFIPRERRKGKLTGDEKVIFSGEFWRGEKALGLGLIDGLGHLNEVLRRKFGEKVELKQIAASTGWGLRRIGMSNPSDLPEAALQALETRAWWSRFGL